MGDLTGSLFAFTRGMVYADAPHFYLLTDLFYGEESYNPILQVAGRA